MPATAYPSDNDRPASWIWPIERPCLAALKDLGLSDPVIARYFRVDLEQVSTLRSSYGIIETAVVTGRRPRARLFGWRRSA